MLGLHPFKKTDLLEGSIWRLKTKEGKVPFHHFFAIMSQYYNISKNTIIKPWGTHRQASFSLEIDSLSHSISISCRMGALEKRHPLSISSRSQKMCRTLIGFPPDSCYCSLTLMSLLTCFYALGSCSLKSLCGKCCCYDPLGCKVSCFDV